MTEKTNHPRYWAFVRGIHRWPVHFLRKGQVTQKCFHVMTSPCNACEMLLHRTNCKQNYSKCEVNPLITLMSGCLNPLCLFVYCRCWTSFSTGWLCCKKCTPGELFLWRQSSHCISHFFTEAKQHSVYGMNHISAMLNPEIYFLDSYWEFTIKTVETHAEHQ